LAVKIDFSCSLPVRNVGMMEVEGTLIDLDNLFEVVVGQVESGSFVGQKFKKYAENIGVDLGSQDDIFVDMPSLEVSMN